MCQLSALKAFFIGYTLPCQLSSLLAGLLWCRNYSVPVLCSEGLKAVFSSYSLPCLLLSLSDLFNVISLPFLLVFSDSSIFWPLSSLSAVFSVSSLHC